VQFNRNFYRKQLYLKLDKRNILRFGGSAMIHQCSLLISKTQDNAIVELPLVARMSSGLMLAVFDRTSASSPDGVYSSPMTVEHSLPFVFGISMAGRP
jgi:hypothetical protein